MKESRLELSAADLTAIELRDANSINDKGAKLYDSESFENAVEYYRLAAAMGSTQAVSNLGYCYLYGRSIAANTSLALAFFKIAAANGSIDAAYKLGDIHSQDKWGVFDKELALYYYRMAASSVIGPDWDASTVIAWIDELRAYPSLCFALGREMAIGGDMVTDLERAYQFLKQAQLGYENELSNGREMYRESYENVLALISGAQFDAIRLRMEALFSEEEGHILRI